METGTKIRINAPHTEYHEMTGVYLGPYYGYANVKLDATGRTLAFGKREVEAMSAKCTCKRAEHETSGLYAHESGKCVEDARVTCVRKGIVENLCHACYEFDANLPSLLRLRKRQKRNASRRERNQLMRDCGLTRGTDSLGRVIWE
jgi:hypothetical protein